MKNPSKNSDKDAIDKWFRPIIVYPAIMGIGTFFIFCAEYYPSIDSKIWNLYFSVSDIFSRKFLKAIGEAVFISGFVGITSEFYNKRRHEKSSIESENYLKEVALQITRETASDMAGKGILAVYKSALSEKIVNSISEYILKSPVIRLKYEITVELRRVEGKVVMLATTSYAVSNTTSNDIKHTVLFHFDKSNCTFPPFKKSVASFSLAKEKIVVTNEELEKCVITREIPIPKGGSVDIMLCISEERAAYDVVYWSMLLPCDYLSLTVITPDQNFDIEVESLHPKPMSIEPTHPNAISQLWTINEAVLPGQGVLLKWNLKDNVIHCLGNNNDI